MKSVLLSRPLGLLVLAVFFACGAGESSPDSSPSLETSSSQSPGRTVAQAGARAVEGELAPDFTLNTLDGDEVTLSGLRGKVIILDFWATWCPPCVKEVPELVELYNEYKSQGLDIVGVSLDRGTGVVKRFAAKNKVSYTMLMADRPVTTVYEPMYIPTTYIIDREGRIVKKLVGYNSKSVFETAIKKLL